MTSAQRRRLPFVILESDAGPDVNSIKIDGRSGALAVIRHLTALGHRKFAILSVRRTAGPAIVHMPGETDRALASGFALDHERLGGFRDALAEAGLSLQDMPDHRDDAGRSRQRAPWCSTTVPEATAIVAMSDWQAITVLDEAGRRGIDVPGHVSVTGFDGTAKSARTTPPLTTVAQDIVGKGRLAAEMVLANEAAASGGATGRTGGARVDGCAAGVAGERSEPAQGWRGLSRGVRQVPCEHLPADAAPRPLSPMERSRQDLQAAGRSTQSRHDASTGQLP